MRAVPYTRIWFGLVLYILVAGAWLGFVAWQTYENYLFAHFSEATYGTVDEKFITISHDKGGPHQHPNLAYHYQAGDFRADAKASVEWATYNAVVPGSPLPVLYLKDAFAKNRIALSPEDYRRRVNFELIISAGAILSALGGGMLLYTVSQNRLNRRLLATGLCCEGTVTSVDYKLMGKAQTPRFFLNLVNRDNQGQEREGKTWFLKPGEETPWHANKPIRVYYDPGRPQVFTVDLNSDRR